MGDGPADVANRLTYTYVANAISGDISVGVQGRMIRNGQRVEPSREATIATTLQKMLLGIAAIGSDVERLPGGTTSVSMAIDDMSLSGT